MKVNWLVRFKSVEGLLTQRRLTIVYINRTFAASPLLRLQRAAVHVKTDIL